jgi:FKBP-type peptidyl-prolyl cis-trans isomerase
VSMSYSGKFLPSGDTFYNATVVPSAIFDSRVVNYIRAFQVGLQKMPVGTTATLYVPSGLAFGSNGSSDGSVPGNSNLIYEITLSAITN